MQNASGCWDWVSRSRRAGLLSGPDPEQAANDGRRECSPRGPVCHRAISPTGGRSSDHARQTEPEHTELSLRGDVNGLPADRHHSAYRRISRLKCRALRGPRLRVMALELAGHGRGRGLVTALGGPALHSLWASSPRWSPGLAPGAGAPLCASQARCGPRLRRRRVRQRDTSATPPGSRTPNRDGWLRSCPFSGAVQTSRVWCARLRRRSGSSRRHGP